MDVWSVGVRTEEPPEPELVLSGRADEAEEKDGTVAKDAPPVNVGDIVGEWFGRAGEVDGSSCCLDRDRERSATVSDPSCLDAVKSFTSVTDNRFDHLFTICSLRCSKSTPAGFPCSSSAGRWRTWVSRNAAWLLCEFNFISSTRACESDRIPTLRESDLGGSSLRSG